MKRLLTATAFVLALPALSAAMPMTEQGLVAADIVLFDFGALLGPTEDAVPAASVFTVETLVIGDSAEPVAGVFFAEIPTMQEVGSVPSAASGGDWLPLPLGETGGGSVGGGFSGGGSSGGSGSAGGGSNSVSIPSPSSLFLIGSGLLGIVAVRRFRWR